MRRLYRETPLNLKFAATHSGILGTSTINLLLSSVSVLVGISNLCGGLRLSSQRGARKLRMRRSCYQKAGRTELRSEPCASSHMSVAQAKICPQLCMQSFHWRQWELCSCNRRQKFGSLILIELNAKRFADAGCKVKSPRVRKKCNRILFCWQSRLLYRPCN